LRNILTSRVIKYPKVMVIRFIGNKEKTSQ
jgi:hypothetical protein